MSEPKSLSEQFDDEMMDVYIRAKEEAGYDAKKFRQMIGPGRGVQAAKNLIQGARVQSGFEKLFLAGKLEITMEARMLKPKFAELFSAAELREAKTRLESAGFDVRRCYE